MQQQQKMEESTASPHSQQLDNAQATLEACQRQICALQEKEASAKAEFLPKDGGVASVLETTFKTVRLPLL